MNKLERRFVRGGQLRARKGDKPGIEGYASVFDQQYDNGWFRETVKPGAFARALREKQDVRCLFNHDANNVLGRSKSGTLRMVEDASGLHFECDTDPNTSIGSDVASMIDRGDVDGCSFGFQVTKQSWREEKGDDDHMVTYRDIEEVDLFDVGPVTYPAYEGTSVGTRSLWPNGVPEDIRSHVPELRGDKKTKRVDNEDLTSDCFLIVGDEDDTSTWKLPWKFSTDEKTKSHLRNALARIDQVKGVSDEDKKKAKAKLIKLCKEHDIDVGESNSHRDVSDGDGACTCTCDPCQDGDCDDCDCTGCDSDNCGNDECRCGGADRARAMRLRIAEASL